MSEISLQTVKQYIYKISVNGRFAGTGFLISDKGYVLTCRHVIETVQNAWQIQVGQYACQEIVLQGKAEDEDYAVLYVQELEGIKPPKVNCGFKPDVNTDYEAKIFGFGQELDSSATAFRAKMNDAFEGKGIELDVLTSSRNVKKGDSGSPLFVNNFIVGWLYAEEKFTDEGKSIVKAFAYLFKDFPELHQFANCAQPVEEQSSQEHQTIIKQNIIEGQFENTVIIQDVDAQNIIINKGDKKKLNF